MQMFAPSQWTGRNVNYSTNAVGKLLRLLTTATHVLERDYVAIRVEVAGHFEVPVAAVSSLAHDRRDPGWASFDFEPASSLRVFH
jgi:hypothetical protein